MRNCLSCKHCWMDFSVGYRECNLEDDETVRPALTEKDMEKYCDDLNEGCPWYEEDNELDIY